MNRQILLIGILGMLLLTGCTVQDKQITAEPHTDAQTEPQVVIQSLPILRVAYPKPDGPWIWTEGEEPRSLAASLNTSNVRISDDGQAVAYMGEGGLYVILLDDGGPNLLLDRAYLDSLTPPGGGFVTINEFDFGVHSHFIYFNTWFPARQQYDLYRVDAVGGTPERIFAPGEGGNFSFSPDGQWMVVYHPFEIILAWPDGVDAHTIFTFPEDVTLDSTGPRIVWSPDSSGFSVVSHAGNWSKPQPMTVWFIPVQGDPVEHMMFQGYLGAHLSPDGGSVVYFDDHDGTIDIHFVDSQGTDTLYASLGTDVFFMDWAPDSRRFILNYVQYRSDSPEMISVPYVCALGEDPIRLTDTPTAYPSYWVDAQRVLFDGDGLRLQELGKASVLIDNGLSINDFDFTLLVP